MAWRICSSLGQGSCAKSAVAAMMRPGMQKPHCIAPVSRNACCTGEGLPAQAKPSIVVTRIPETLSTKERQDRTGSPSSSTVQEPQTP